MRKLRAWICRLGGVLNKGRRDRELAQELETHLQYQIQDNLRLGMSPVESRREALIQLGGIESTKEACRDQRGIPMLESFLQDLRYALRVFGRNPGFTFVAIVTLALGIGANTASYSLVKAVLFRPLPFQNPDRLVWITNPILNEEGLPGMHRQVTLRDWRELNRSFEGLGGYLGYSARMNYTLTGRGEPTRLQALSVTGDFLQVLGVRLQRGRNFVEAECQRNAPGAMILTDRCWKRQFRADPDIVGRSVTINEAPWMVVGILPADFDFSSVFTPGAKEVDFLKPFPEIGSERWANFWTVIGRLKPSVTLPQAQTELNLLNDQLQRAHPARGKFGARLVPLREQVSGQFRRPLAVLSCSVACVLLIACVNLSNLLLARASARRKEIAVRIALGAGRWRLVQQLLTESITLALCGAALSLPLAYVSTSALARSQAFSLPLLATAHVDGSALWFTLLIACCTGLLFGLIPALQLSRAEVQDDFKDAGRGGGQDLRRSWVRQGLIVSEMGLACLLLVSAGLFTRSFSRLLNVDLGFQPQQVAVWHIIHNLPLTNSAQEDAFHAEVIRRVQALPGVESVGSTGTLPFTLNDMVSVHAKGETFAQGASLREADDGYFKTMRILLQAGRVFDRHDVGYDQHHPPGTQEVVVINEKMAQLLWPGKDPVGQILLIDDRSPPLNCRVVGVVANVRQSPLEVDAGPEIYLLSWGRDLLVRTTGTLEALLPAMRATLRQVSSTMPLDDVKPFTEIVDRSISPKRFLTMLLAFFSILALLLASVGIYGVVAYSVSQRTREIGIRLALGSPRQRILRHVLGEGMRVALFGCMIGMTVALALSRALRSLLFDVKATDPLTYVASGLVLLAVALLACWIPARRATRVDPIVALKNY